MIIAQDIHGDIHITAETREEQQLIEKTLRDILKGMADTMKNKEAASKLHEAAQRVFDRQKNVITPVIIGCPICGETYLTAEHHICKGSSNG